MGGHGGLNILPQKRWNVYNYENREKVKRDEEAAAKEEQLKREQSRKRDAELRLEKLRRARGLSNPSTQAETSIPASTSTSTSTQTPADHSKESESDSNHINLFEGIKIFDPIKAGEGERGEKKGRFWRDNNINGNKKVKREEQVRAVNLEDEKYRMGYGVAGKGVKLPWYMEKRRNEEKTGDTDNDNDYDTGMAVKGNRKGAGGKKSLEELREDRLKRERMEKEREKALVMEKSRREGGFSSRRR